MTNIPGSMNKSKHEKSAILDQHQYKYCWSHMEYMRDTPVILCKYCPSEMMCKLSRSNQIHVFGTCRQSIA